MAEKGRARLGLDRLVRGKRGQSEARARSGRAEPSRAFLTLHELGELKRSGSRRPLVEEGEALWQSYLTCSNGMLDGLSQKEREMVRRVKSRRFELEKLRKYVNK